VNPRTVGGVDRIRVLFVSSTLASGGAERFASTVLAHLDRSRFEPSLALLRPEIEYPLPADVPVESLGKRRPWHIPAAILRLSQRIDRDRPDAVVSVFAHPNLIAGSALVWARHRSAWLARVSLPPALTDPLLLSPWMRHLYRRADAIVANSLALCREFAARYPRTVPPRHLPNAVDFERIDALARETVARPAGGRLRVVAVGRLEAQKRFDLLLEAAARLAPQLDLELVVCGEGRERARLAARARALGVGERLKLPGFVANPFAWLASADLFALSSDSEGLPNALIEAQGVGVAAVATDCPTGPAEIVVHGETGLLVPVGDPAALAAAMAALLRDPERRLAMGRAARERARRLHAAPAVTRALEAHLVEITRR
jgi:N-acetylgalactosamine-N,N'-diacetylbacillosaminyl-diphospho-undecaprenol 4-alpha-N-acetylgalactosaminyltransferase